MVEQNKELFNTFKRVHDNFTQDENKWKNEYNEVGGKVVEVIRIWEGKLCAKTEGGSYTKFSPALSEKFWAEVRKHYSHIDLVGVK